MKRIFVMKYECWMCIATAVKEKTIEYFELYVIIGLVNCDLPIEKGNNPVTSKLV